MPSMHAWISARTLWFLFDYAETAIANAEARAARVERRGLTGDDAPHTQMALARTNLMAGCLQAVLDLGLQFAAERMV